MKKIISLTCLVLTLLTVGAFVFQSCTKDFKNKTALTAETLVADDDFRAIALLENQIKAKMTFFDPNISDARRLDYKQELLTLGKMNPKSATLNDLTRVAKIMGYSSLVDFQTTLADYSKQYLKVRNKYKDSDNFSEQSYDEIFRESYAKNLSNLPWKLKKNATGMLVIMPSNLSLNNLGTLQTRSCSCNFSDCNTAARKDGNDCDSDLNL